ncbi:GMC family oxidoreductase [Paraburkholderia pallida]|uniref:Dehydrogenase n=1 Tax=Paraburkholderia pallida TaxID=2547399 RepID=A0A4P7D7F8_9BURK|nr:GMC family oxidoreductase N-terminal domain-containing protein [Paraburkholderia pallida]QBR04128.1 dehydrogenase [Paraburkholderia pallida]
MSAGDFDYVIVGAGSAGCALAYRLGANPALRILVIEAGGPDRSPIIKVPLAWGLILKHRWYDWGYFTARERGMDERSIEFARGKVVGGCSSINGMAYARGMREDYDGWANDFGVPGWSFRDVLPYFKRSEAWEGGESELRGGSGPLTVTRMNYQDPLVDGFIEAAARCGYSRNDDYNGASAEGFGPMQATIRDGLRCSAALAYLRPALARRNVVLMTNAQVRRVLLDDAPTPRAIGVEYCWKGQRHVVNARQEVLLAGGVINSPQLLMLSGIGDPAQLARHDIPARVSLPGVGRNLHDHIVFDLRWKRREPGPLHRMMRADRIGFDVMRTALFGDGMSSKIPAAAVGLIRTRAALALPDAQLILAAAPMTAGPYLTPFKKAYVDAFAIKGVFLTPQSRGQVSLASADPARAPVIEQNFLASESDREAAREMFKRMSEIGAQTSMQAFIADEISPGRGHIDDAQIDAFIRRTAITLHHPVGTCRMGSERDPQAVLDARLRVRGVNGLRVVDGSAMPRIVRGPTNAPILMMAERIADDILDHEPLRA